MRLPRYGLSIGAVLGVLTACAPGADAESVAEVLIQDSAGVTIVVNPAGSEGRAPTWAVDPNPILRIGVLDGEHAYQFGRIDGIAKLSDGRIVVLDGLARELRYFDDSGRHLYSVGGRGEGPGELFPAGNARLFSLPDDTVATWTLSRLTLFHGEGEFIEAVDGSFATPLGLLANRSVIVFHGETLSCRRIRRG